MLRWITSCLVLVTLLVAAPAQAQTSLAAKSGRAWKHESSGLTIPAEADDFDRVRASDFSDSESNISFAYENAQAAVTLFIFRAGNPDPAIWAERADVAIQLVAEKAYGTLDMAGRRWSRFTPWPNSPDSGITVVYPVSGKQAIATGVLVARHGDWVIKVRMTSDRLDAPAVEARLRSFLAALGFKAPELAVSPAYQIGPCKDALSRKSAKLAEPDEGGSFIGSAVINSIAPDVAADKAKKDGALPAPTYCKDATSSSGYSVLRPDGANNAYIIALGDAGNVLVVGPDLSGLGAKKPQQQYSVTGITSDRVFGFVPYQSLPPPAQAVDMVSKGGKVIFTRSRLPGHDKEVQIVM